MSTRGCFPPTWMSLCGGNIMEVLLPQLWQICVGTLLSSTPFRIPRCTICWSTSPTVCVLCSRPFFFKGFFPKCQLPKYQLPERQLPKSQLPEYQLPKMLTPKMSTPKIYALTKYTIYLSYSYSLSYNLSDCSTNRQFYSIRSSFQDLL